MNIIQKALFTLALKSGAFTAVQNSTGLDFWGVNEGFLVSNGKTSDDYVNEGYASNTDLYAIIRKIHLAASNIPLEVYEKTKNGLELAEDSALNELLNKPNKSQTQTEFREAALTYKLLTGDRFLHLVKSVGFKNAAPDALEILPSNATNLKVRKGEVIGYETTINGVKSNYAIDEVIYSKLFNPTKEGLTSLRGMSPLQAAYRTLTASNELITAEASFYKNKGAAGILTSDSDQLLTEEEALRVQAAVKEKLGGANKSNSIITTGARLKYQSIGMSPSDMEMIKSGEVKLRSLCRAYGLDSKLLGDSAASTYNNMSEVQKQMYTDAAVPHNQSLVDDINGGVTPLFNKQEGKTYVVKQNTSQIEALQGDKKTEAEKDKIVVDGILQIVTSQTSDEAKITLLKDVYGVDEEKAKILVSNV